MEKPDGPKDPELLKCWNAAGSCEPGSAKQNGQQVIILSDQKKKSYSHFEQDYCHIYLLLYGLSIFQTLIKRPEEKTHGVKLLGARTLVLKKSELIFFLVRLWIGWKWYVVVGVMH